MSSAMSHTITAPIQNLQQSHLRSGEEATNPATAWLGESSHSVGGGQINGDTLFDHSSGMGLDDRMWRSQGMLRAADLSSSSSRFHEHRTMHSLSPSPTGLDIGSPPIFGLQD
jgi:hypothetical protein